MYHVEILLSSYANCSLLAAVSCTRVHSNRKQYKFAQIVQEAIV